MFNVAITGATEFASRLKKMSLDMDRRVHEGMQKVAILVENHVRSNKLSGQVLGVRSGTLRRNVKGIVRRVGSDIHAVIGTRDIVAYGRIHELGGTSGRGKQSVMPERPYLQPAVVEKQSEIVSILGESVNKAIQANEGRDIL